jgi:hypothetical protein
MPLRLTTPASTTFAALIAGSILIVGCHADAQDVGRTPQIEVPSLVLPASAAGPGYLSPPKMCEPNHIMVDHPFGDDHFATTSWYHATKNAHLYTTCVENRGSKTVYIDWPIPGPKRNYISAGDSAHGPRVFTDHNTVDVLGCLIYGGYRMAIKEQFLGHIEGIQRAKDDEDCSKARQGQVASLIQLAEPPWFNSETSGRASFPSDAKDIDGTLIRLDYWINLRPGPEKRYTIDFIYQAGAVFPEKYHGNINDVTVRGGSDILSQAIKETRKSDGIIHLEDYKGAFLVSPEMPAKFSLINASYDFFDRYGQPVASIYVPLLLPIP